MYLLILAPKVNATVGFFDGEILQCLGIHLTYSFHKRNVLLRVRRLHDLNIYKDSMNENHLTLKIYTDVNFALNGYFSAQKMTI